MFQQIPVIDRIPADIRTTVGQVFIAIALVVILWLLRHVVTGLIVNPIRKRVSDTDTQTDDAIFRAVDGSISYLIMGLGAFLFVAIVGLGEGPREFAISLGISLIIIAVIKAVYEMVIYITRSPERLHRVTRLDVDASLIPITRVSAQVLVALVGLFAVANVWGVNLTGLLTGIGLGGLAISLAAKEVLDDIMGYIVIMSDDPFDLDEYIISPHAEGIVENIGVRSTRIRRLDQGLAIVPNSVIVSDEIVNWSRLDKRWFNFMLGLQYDTPPDKMSHFTERVREMLRGRESVDEESVVVLFTEYDDSSLNVLIRSYIDIADWTAAKQERHAVNLEIMNLAKATGVEMAFPSRSLYVEKVPDGLSSSNGSNGHRTESPNPARKPLTQNNPQEYSDSDSDYEVEDYADSQRGGDGEDEE